jgi:hypothetical protein
LEESDRRNRLPLATRYTVLFSSFEGPNPISIFGGNRVERFQTGKKSKKEENPKFLNFVFILSSPIVVLFV